MLKSATQIACLFLFALLILPSSANAIPIPCTGDRIVTIIGIPQENQPAGMKLGKNIALAYRFPGCFSDGEWIGYMADERKYIKLDETQLKLLLQIAGAKEVPPRPSRWQYPLQTLWVEALWSGALVVGAFWQMMDRREKRNDERLMREKLAIQQPDFHSTNRQG
ncbi:MAG: hypothetical protein ABL893_20050 [Hyphomicrobium sp.]|nr:hypothetical protein [Hyphomicrobium sp.]